MQTFEGGCHCGNIHVTYKSAVPPERSEPRACQCSFCRKHNSRTISDPKGHLDITVQDDSRLTRYRFELGVADYLVCRTCGVYVGAFMADPAEPRGYATLMANALDAQADFPAPTPIVYDGENAAGKRERRRVRWTPATLTIARS